MMKSKITKQLLIMGALLVVSATATAATVNETGIGYMHTDSMSSTPTTDGLILLRDTSHGSWVLQGVPEGFQSVLKGRCSGTTLLDQQFTNKGASWLCTATDNVGDGMSYVGIAHAPDFSDCSVTIIAGWGKYAGVKGSGNCQPLGGFGGQDTMIYSWTSQWTVPD